ncbi:MAG: hypothetical protein KBT12_02345 [Bacteroidales bacterium]|nr:hypothetical protein [Candidatus Physcousia equi]
MTGRDRRLRYEYELLEQRFASRDDIRVEVTGRNASGIPNRYLVHYRIRCFCAVTDVDHLNEPGFRNQPLFAEHFLMAIELPPAYPSVDASPVFRFLTHDEHQQPIPHPWHPNIRWFGEMAGRVCLNAPDTYTDLAWGVARVAQYLRYERYHATNEPPYPEDRQVAIWTLKHLDEI